MWTFFTYIYPKAKQYSPMKSHNHMHRNTINVLVSEYEAMSQKGTVGFFEETVFFSLLEHYRNNRLYDRALEVVDHALDQHSYTVDFYVQKAQLLIEKEQYQWALECVQHALLYAPNNLEIRLLMAEVYVSLGRIGEGLDLLERLKSEYNEKSSDELAEIFFCEACIQEHLMEWNNMFEALKKAISFKHPNKTLLQRLWISVEMSKRYEESVELHRTLIDNDPFCPITWYNLGHAYFCIQDLKNAEAAFEYAYLNDNSFLTAYKDRADVLIRLERYSEAMDCFKEAIEHAKADSEIFVGLGFCYEHQKMYSKAQPYYEKALELDPNDDSAYYRIGECLAQEGKWEDAIEAYNKAMDLNDCLEEYIAALAVAYCQIDAPEKANALFLRATETAPEQAQCWLQYACFLMDMNLYKEALENLEMGIVAAGGMELLYCKVVCLFLKNDRKAAMLLLSQLLYKDFPTHEYLYKLSPELEEDNEVQTLIKSFDR